MLLQVLVWETPIFFTMVNKQQKKTAERCCTNHLSFSARPRQCTEINMLQDIYFSIRFVLFFTHEDVFSCRWMSVFRSHCVRASTEYVVRRRHVRRNVSPTWLTWMPNGVFTLIVWRYYWPPLFSRSWRYIDSGLWRREEARRRHSVTCLQNTLYTVFHQTHVGDSVNFQRIFQNKFRCQVLQENCSNVFIKDPSAP